MKQRYFILFFLFIKAHITLFLFNMMTIVFVETFGPFNCGYQLSSDNIRYAPNGRVRIARYSSCFVPLLGHGYYGDVYMRAFVRRWKRAHDELKRRRSDKKNARECLCNLLIDDIISEIALFL